MYNKTEDYRTAVANVKSHAIIRTIGTIANKIGADQKKNKITRLPQMKSFKINAYTINTPGKEPLKIFANESIKKWKNAETTSTGALATTETT